MLLFAIRSATHKTLESMSLLRRPTILIANGILLLLATLAPVWSQLTDPSSPTALPGGSVLSGKNPLAKGQGAASPSNSNLTPEQRQARQKAKRDAELKAEELRMTTFGVIPPSDNSPLAVSFRKASDNLRQTIADFTLAHVRIQHRLKEELPNGVREKWLEKLKESNDALIAYRSAAADLYASDPTQYAGVGSMLKEMLIDDGRTDRLDHWIDPAKKILDAKTLVDDDVLLYAGYAGFFESDFDLVRRAWADLQSAQKLGPQESILLSKIDEIEKSWADELLRRQEDKTKNNPQVRVLTTKGEIIVELFEDDAPESVANFIYLVEQGYYPSLIPI